MFVDAAERKIKEPIDYLIEAEKRVRKTGLALHMAEMDDLALEADTLYNKIRKALDDQPIEAWETARHGNRFSNQGGLL